MTSQKIKIATTQLSFTADIKENGENVKELMNLAYQENANIIHFAEGSLSGYCKSEIESWDYFNWEILEEELEKICKSAKELNMYVVIGGCCKNKNNKNPFNSLYIISNKGCIEAIYDKQLLSHSEITNWYSPGQEIVTFQIHGITFGCALCIEINFPELFKKYLDVGVDCMLISSYSKSKIFEIYAQAYAGLNNYWVSLSIPEMCSKNRSSMFIGPDGEIISQCKYNKSDLIVNEIDPTNMKWDIPLNKAKKWRRIARKGDIYK